MTHWRERLKNNLEPALGEEDPRPKISSYHNMPYAIFVYPPEDEFEVRQEMANLETRLSNRGKRVTRISLAECLGEAIAADGYTAADLAEAERTMGLDKTLDTVHAILTDQSLDELVAAKFPKDATPTRDVIFIYRAGALYPFYRTSALLEQLAGKVDVPAVLFYPGREVGGVGLSFMGILEPEHNYRPRKF